MASLTSGGPVFHDWEPAGPVGPIQPTVRSPEGVYGRGRASARGGETGREHCSQDTGADGDLPGNDVTVIS